MASTLTAFGLFARKLRLEHGHVLKDMANHLGVSTAYLSAVERGQRNAPTDWSDRLQKAYELSEADTKHMKEAIDESQAYVKIDVSHLPIVDRRLLLELAKQFPSLSDKEKATILKMIQ